MSRMKRFTFNLAEVTKRFKYANKDAFKRVYQNLMLEYGTRLHCNRFPIGNCIGYAIVDLTKEIGFQVVEHQSATRIDMKIEGFGKFSIKYSSGGNNIKLHNSNNQSNTDISMRNTLLVTPTTWWFLQPLEIENMGISLNDYLKNTGDGLELKSSILTALKKTHYPFMFDFDIRIDKSKCKNKEISRIIYDSIKQSKNT